MTDPPTKNRAQSRLVRIFLRDHRVMEGLIVLPDITALAVNLGTRGWINVTRARWLGTGEARAHLVLAADRILWTGIIGEATRGPQAVGTAGSPHRAVEVTSESGVLLRGRLGLAPQQRMSDYLSTAPQFITLRDARLVPQGHALGDVVVNQRAMLTIREVTDEELEAERSSVAASAGAPTATPAEA